MNIEELVPKLDTIDDVYGLFTGLDYKTLNSNYKANLNNLGLRAKEKDYVENVYVVSNYEKMFQIYFIKLKTHSNETIRSILELFHRSVQYPLLVFSADYINYSFVVVKSIRKDIGKFEDKIIRLNVDKNNLYRTDAEVLSNLKLDGETAPDVIYRKILDAFSVEKVTDKFFKEYIALFKSVKKYASKQIQTVKTAHDFTQQLLNRIMFIYFVSKKRWLGNDLKFMSGFWKTYNSCKKKNAIEPDTFYRDWLSVMFFEAFNNQFAKRRYFPDELNNTLIMAPYLNGGLFTRNDLDDIDVPVKDDIFGEIFNFFDHYNFTIREDQPLEEEVAVDPEMIGRVYESLVNSLEEEEEISEPGVVYTARVEIDFMSRRSLVEYFYTQLQQDGLSKEIIYKLVFAKTDDEKKKAEGELNNVAVWENIESALDNLSILDPACGSGSFLVGMLNILSNLYKITYKKLNRPINDFEIKKQIIGRSLYGVDIMEWACHVAELRLWLQLIVESELTLGDLKIKPLLPNLTFKIRPGDSLVQEIGSIDLSLSSIGSISASSKRKLTELKNEKLKFYNNEPSRKYLKSELILHEETRIYKIIIDERVLSLENRIKQIEKEWNGTRAQQESIIVDNNKVKEALAKYDAKSGKALKQDINEKEKINEEIEFLKEILKMLNKGLKPFVWEIDFVEIFFDEYEKGFDIVIGNPPYIRQEKIADPKLPKDKITNENKREYKEKLLRSIQKHFPFIKNIDKKSDLYVYFYFKGLALLNPTGTFCFITSNSWLDVGYGAELQEFLLNNVKMHAIYDNSAKRSFSRADVNTIIALFSAPLSTKVVNPVAANFSLRNGLRSDLRSAMHNNLVRFVMFRKPFEDVLTIDNLLKIEKADKVFKTDDFRVYPKTQIQLLQEGWEYPEDVTEEKKKKYGLAIGKYEGNKWGGKYLRAPDIYFTILEKGKDKLVRLGDIAEIRRGFTTGCNEFFYVEDVTEMIEDD